LVALPPFSGFYSKDAIIDAVGHASVAGAHYAYLCLLFGAAVTALYTFRMFFMAFHGDPRMPEDFYNSIKESPKVVVWPLVILAVPSLFLGMMWAYPLLYAPQGWLSQSITVLPHLNSMASLVSHYHGALMQCVHALTGLPFWFALAGIVYAYAAFLRYPQWSTMLSARFTSVVWVLRSGYGFDRLNHAVFVGLGSKVCEGLYRYADIKCIDEALVNGSGRGMMRVASFLRRMQNGYLQPMLLLMVLGVVVFLCWLLLA
jgi:NADH-quinone oxidoreductase subunit L